MANEEIPEKVLRFIETKIDSVEQLSVLLLLHSSQERSWSIAEINSALRSAETSIANRLNALYERNVLVRVPDLQGRHRFSPSTPEMSALVEELVIQNRLRPYRVIDAIFSRPHHSLREFVSAFKLRKDEE